MKCLAAHLASMFGRLAIASIAFRNGEKKGGLRRKLQYVELTTKAYETKVKKDRFRLPAGRSVEVCGPIKGVVGGRVKGFTGPVLKPQRNFLLGGDSRSDGGLQELIDFGSLNDTPFARSDPAHDLGECRQHHRADLFGVIGMAQ